MFTVCLYLFYYIFWFLIWKKQKTNKQKNNLKSFTWALIHFCIFVLVKKKKKREREISTKYSISSLWYSRQRRLLAFKKNTSLSIHQKPRVQDWKAWNVRKLRVIKHHSIFSSSTEFWEEFVLQKPHRGRDPRMNRAFEEQNSRRIPSTMWNKNNKTMGNFSP